MKSKMVLIDNVVFDNNVIEFICENYGFERVVEVEVIKELGRYYREDGGELEMCDKLDELYNLLSGENDMKSIELLV
jgi:hypothetical protein